MELLPLLCVTSTACSLAARQPSTTSHITIMILSLFLFTTSMVLPTLSKSLSAPSPNKFDCRTLAVALLGKVFFPESPNYTSSANSYFAAFQNELAPTCIVQPASAQDVSTIITRIKGPALSGQVLLAVRSGGHTLWAGAANIQNGVTLDL